MTRTPSRPYAFWSVGGLRSRRWSCPAFVDTELFWEEETTMPRTHPPYPPEFRCRMVELVRSGAVGGVLKTGVRRAMTDKRGHVRAWVHEAGPILCVSGIRGIKRRTLDAVGDVGCGARRMGVGARPVGSRPPVGLREDLDGVHDPDAQPPPPEAHLELKRAARVADGQHGCPVDSMASTFFLSSRSAASGCVRL